MGPLELPGQGVQRVLAAASALKAEIDLDVRFFDYGRLGKVGLAHALDSFEPDIVGSSIYVRSTGIRCLILPSA